MQWLAANGTHVQWWQLLWWRPRLMCEANNHVHGRLLDAAMSERRHVLLWWRLVRLHMYWTIPRVRKLRWALTFCHIQPFFAASFWIDVSPNTCIRYCAVCRVFMQCMGLVITDGDEQTTTPQNGKVYIFFTYQTHTKHKFVNPIKSLEKTWNLALVGKL